MTVVHTAGASLCEPTVMKPCGPAATASTWLEPVAGSAVCARVQLVRSFDHQSSATHAPPLATSLPSIRYPAGPQAVVTVATLARSGWMFPPAACQLVPSSET